MRNKGLMWFLVTLAMALAVIVFILLSNNNYSWYQRLTPDGKQPYDVSVLKKLLKKNANAADFTELSNPYNLSLTDLSKKNIHNLVVVRPYWYPDTAELFALNEFLNNGNNVFIASQGVTPMLAMQINHGKDSVHNLVDAITSKDVHRFVPDSIIKAYEDVPWDKTDSIHELYQAALIKKLYDLNPMDTGFVKRTLFGVHKSSGLRILLARRMRNDTTEHQWKSVKTDIIRNGVATAYYDTLARPAMTITWEVGEGKLTLCSTPIIFTNVYFAKRENFEFANTLLNQLSSGPILWDEVVRYNNNFNFGPGNGLGQSPLSFIMSQRSLKWAWFILLGTIILFVVFRSKRRQRIIPIFKPNQNTTLAYAQLLGSLQLKEKNNAEKANEIYQHFLQHLRSRFRWNTNLENKALQKRLVKIAPDLQREIQVVLHVGTIAGKEQYISDEQLINLFNYTNLIIQRT